MGLIALAIVVSSLLGVASYYFEQLFYGMLVAILPLAWLLFKFLLIAAPVADPNAVGTGRLTLYTDAFNNAPSHVQLSILLLPICFFGWRLVTWVYNKAFEPDPVVENKAARKQRILDSYNMSSD